MIFDVFIRRPRLAMVISIVLTLAGLIATQTIPVAQYPEIAPPTVRVSASYPGADAITVEESIAQPLENAINGVTGMQYMKSTSANDGSYSITVSFLLGTDPDINTVNVQNRANLATAKLPEEVRRTGLTIAKVSTDLLQVFLFYSPNGDKDQLFLSNFVTLNILDELKRVPGVGDASIFGARDYAMRVWIDPQKLANFGLTAQDVIQAIQSQNLQAAAGRVGAAPLSDDQRLQLTVTTKGRLSTTEEFGNIVVRSGGDGSFVRVNDVARIELEAASFDTEARYEGKPAAPVAIYLSPGANAVNVATAVSKRLEQLQERFPEGVEFAYVYNTAEFVSAMIDKVIHTLIEAFALVALVVFIFLGRLRPTFIPLLAVPVAIIGTFAILLAAGFSANTISLLALVLAIGIVVDDAIIVVENVERVMHEEPHLSPADATRKAMAEIAGPVIAITLVLLSVFVPVAFLAGSSGVLFRQFAITISAAMVISAINALTLAPALCSIMLKPGHPVGVMKHITRAIDGVANGYAVVVRRLVAVSMASIVAVAAIGGATYWLLLHTPSGFLPDEDKGFVIGVITLPAGASLNRTSEAAQKAEAIVRADPAVDGVTSILGIDFLGGGAASNAGVMFIRLKPYEERTASTMHSTAVAARLMGAFSVIPDGTVMAVNPPAISGLGQVGGFEYVLEALQGQTPPEMAAAMRGLVVAANQKPELRAVFSTFEAETPLVRLDIDRDKTRTLNISLSDVFAALQATLGGYYVNDFNLYGRTWTVRMQAEQQFRSSVEDISAIYVRNSAGEMTPLSAIADVRLDVGPRTLTRYNNYRAISINGGPGPGRGPGEAIDAMQAVSAETLPAGYAYEWTGQAREQIDSAGQTVIVLGLAVLFAYLFLVALYESWMIPIPVLLSVIVSLLGAVAALWALGMSFTLYAQIGLVVLVALAAKNAILIVAFSIERRAAGESVIESAIEGARLRFRPVMMTSFAFIMGLVPLVIANGPGADSMIAVGVPVLAGMLAASAFGIFLIPMLYVVFQRLQEGRAVRNGTNADGSGTAIDVQSTSSSG
ncbi:efflux RND transporter permease subunit [Hyphomicrobium sulfonivorans]|uniref:efflux RND transporter permease subunit n=1 Tax=Hyphomicrobium sulfonivorans TaxID=121290 RepID=UPI00156E9A71|nr:multidrug efflux RND transporter permease subunit [Hyphomicrobium sulfonivorans]MBI1650861.1 multidrug efflux RND transporter permease subunit [Hyphomicrobium sulfonivorans]NSL72758.1 hydrophobe/amphiphile efflux-1 family RND transporter [Hyphomicrobium sulfonivorans]